jgi:hypothetical protein
MAITLVGRLGSKEVELHFNKAYDAAFAAYEKDAEQMKAIGDRLITSATALLKEKISNSAKNDKIVTIKAQLVKVYSGLDEARARLKAAVAKVDEERDKYVEHEVNLIAGICSYANASAGHRYLLGEVEEFRKAKGDPRKRVELFLQVCDVFAHVVDAITKERGPTASSNSLITELERLQNRDPERASQFYRAHRDEILSEYQARQSEGNQQPKA